MTALRGTYRLQLGTDLDFAAARELVPYLKDLGVSHLYLSPSFQARPGSTHGYDVTDPGRISEELGGEDEFRALGEAGLGVILDIVPNHMAAADENRYWADPKLRAKFIDIDHETGRWRRFFDIDHLAAVRQEDPEVFAETHRLALRLVRDGLVDGLRIDHPDGLADPAGYLRRLRAEGVDRVWVEKILDHPHLEEALSMLPVYRTYVPPVEDADREALAGNPLSSLLLGTEAPKEFVTRFQQTTPAIMAKGVEDTAFYRYNRLVALNEVGGDPTRFGVSVEQFHAGSLVRARRFPNGLLITQTHDTKRSGDVRARIGALAGMAGEWAEHAQRWRALVPAEEAPSWSEAYLVFQTLVGAWPLEPERLEAYVEKALREAKLSTNWVEPDEAYERSVRDWCRALYSNSAFVSELELFAERVAHQGERSALGQTLLKLAAPGVPDVYQGDELWALSLVDPDNRRPVDWDRRRAALAELRAGAEPDRGTIKLFLIERALALRARRPEAFAGTYSPLQAGEDCCAYLRGEVPFERLAMSDWGMALLEGVDG